MENLLKSEIAYQNKDITSKFFAEKFVGKSFQVYGIDLPKIKQVLPTNLPMIQANELRIDNLFLLEDNSFLVVDYESVYRSENKIKYLNYVLRILERYYKEYGIDIKISVLVIYTGDVTEDEANDTLDTRSVKMKIDQAFLSILDSNRIKSALETKVRQGKKLTDEDLMQYIILPLTYRGIDQKKNSIKELFELTKEIKEEETQLFLLSGILVFTDKVIDEDTAKQIKEWIRMTKVARLFEEEKIEAVKQATKLFEEEKLEAMKQVAKETAKEMLKEKVDIDVILRCLKHLSMYDIEKLQKELQEKKCNS